MSKPRFIVVSNRLPVTVTKVDGKLEYSASAGGLATAMSSVEVDGEQLWIGWPGITTEQLTSAEQKSVTEKLRKDYGCIPVFLDENQLKNFYEGYSNETIWPLFHYFQDIAEYDDNYWESYKQTNQQFADIVLKHSSKQDTVWVHDYHLMLLPNLLKTALPELSIGFFLHIPFPSFEIFRLIPQRQELLTGLLGADLVGFHVYDYVRHFSTSVYRTLGYPSKYGNIAVDHRLVKADAFPIGIDYQKFADAANSDEVAAEIEILDQNYKDKLLILSVDRLDYSKGIMHRLEAFETFLQNNQQHHGEVVLMVVAVPSRTEVEAYKDLRDKIELTVGRINGTYGSANWTPVVYQYQNQSFPKLLALYARSKVALVTPVRDGMNLVAKEYIAAKQSSNGVLILSELTGAVDELPEALIINPNNRNSVAKAIQTALDMPEDEQASRLKTMQRRIARYNVQAWAAEFIETLGTARQEFDASSSKLLTRTQKHEIINHYKQSDSRLIILDYDGTLREFVGSPRTSQAEPPKKLLETLEKLAAQPENDIYIVSGRPRSALDSWFEKLNVSLIAEHGYWIKRYGKWHARGKNPDKYKSLAIPIMQEYTERTPGSILEDKTSSLVWHFRNVGSELASARKRNLRNDLQSVLEGSKATVHEGNMIVEVKPKNVNKGSIVASFDIASYDFILCIGDDYTDEDMFKLLEDNSNAATIKVGLGVTSAKHQLVSVPEVLNLLKNLT